MDGQIEDALDERNGKVDGVYLIPAFNELFLSALEKLRFQRSADRPARHGRSSAHHLETGRLSAVVYQNPILQGY
jgi:hypothetical protein